MRRFPAGVIIFMLLLVPYCALGIERADLVLVVKSESTLYLIKNRKILKRYKVSLGANPKGHKRQEGDKRTPEGAYILDYKKIDSTFYKAIHISYPNGEDVRRARKAGVDPGGCIMIHGQKNGCGTGSISRHINWTDGCIALSNSDMDEIWESVAVGTPIKILP